MAPHFVIALLFGALMSFRRPLAGRARALAPDLVAAAAGFAAALVLGRFAPAASAPESWAIDTRWIEISAALCVFALGLSGGPLSPWEELLPEEAAPEAEDSRFAELFQSFALGAAAFCAAWAFAAAFLMLKAAGNLVLAAQEKTETSPKRDPRLDWLAGGEMPSSFIAALNAGQAQHPDRGSGSRSMSPALRQIRAVHNGAKPLDARSSANRRSTAPGHDRAEPRKSLTAARDRAPGRR